LEIQVNALTVENESLKKALQENLSESEHYNLVMTEELEKLN
jgi:hypothetical protein